MSGQSYESFLRQAIFEPLGMLNTGADQPTLILLHRAAGYVRERGIIKHADYLYMLILTGGGNLYSTVEDLSRWDQALVSGKFISPTSYQRMYTPEKEHYAYGWVVQRRSGHLVIGHGGEVPGFNGFILRYPEQQVCVVVLSNVVPMPVLRIASNLVAIVFGESLSTR